ncbi:2823_t:CDS:2 [Dentiscutata erythropus]|uniref:2823_t:CDS:1 n=1 Tax=Dentiscutata erythropus TaxID=1348616 RepID=A0A9N9FMS7_9GLOM|nr:2823_t:CDS:2 [Dentiscutata erythropus]
MKNEINDQIRIFINSIPLRRYSSSNSCSSDRHSPDSQNFPKYLDWLNKALDEGHFFKGKRNDAIGVGVMIARGEREVKIDGTPDDYVLLFEKCWSQSPHQRPELVEILESLDKLSTVKTESFISYQRQNTNYITQSTHELPITENSANFDITQSKTAL